MRLADELERHGVGRALIQHELVALAEPKLGKNADRSLLGTVNDLVWHAEGHAERARTVVAACDAAQAGLNRIPHVNRKPCLPDQAITQVFATRH